MGFAALCGPCARYENRGLVTRPLHRSLSRSSAGRRAFTMGLGIAALLGSSAVFFGCAEGRSIQEAENVCGDGRPRDGEQCDEADSNSDKEKDACRTDCTLAGCGDGVRDTGEQCDDGNEDNGDGCDKSCSKTYTCGDDVCDEDMRESCSVCADDCCPCGDAVCTVGEVCNECPSDCCPACGDGVLDGGEGCDDGNNEGGDGCAKGCSDEDGVATCGNDFLEASEVCDDGNTEGADGCGPDCQLEYVCGDQVCEDMVGETCETCLADCCPRCGDTLVNDFEECDASVPAGAETCLDLCYAGGTPTCQANCLLDYSTCQGELPICGNGIIECGEECDDEATDGATCADVGREGGALSCIASCELDASDCGDILSYLETHFDEGCPADWTLASPWQCGPPTAGPGTAYSAPNVLSTALAGSYPSNQSYFANTATSPPINLGLALAPVLTFWIWHDLENNFDAVQVQTSADGVSFAAALTVTPAYGEDQGWTGVSAGWVLYSANLSSLVGQEQARIRFGLVTDGSGTRAGAFIDDIVVSEACGNGVLDAGEVCDDDAVGLAVCPARSCGTPTCADDCSEILGGEGCVVPDCGDGVRECDEECDDDDLDGSSCDDLGYEGGDLACTSQCEFDLDDCGELSVLLPLQSFETCPPAGWTLAGIWECGVPTSGPSSANTGTRVIATNLEGDYNNGHTYAVDYAQTPPFPVAGPSPTLSFAAWIRTEDSVDGMHVEASTDGTTWSVVTGVSPAYTGTAGGSPAWEGILTTWTPYTADLSPYLGSTLRLRFAFRSDVSVLFPGVYVDDVTVVPSVDLVPVMISSPGALGDIFTGDAVSVALTANVDDLAWSIADSDNANWLDVDANTGVLSGTPGVGDVGVGSVTIRAEKNGAPSVFDEVTLPFEVIDPVYRESFASCPAGFTFTGDWECGDPTSGPTDAFSPPNCVGTNTYSSSVTWGSSLATSPMINLAGTTDPQLSFWLYSDTELAFDRSRLEISVDGGAFTVFSAVTPAYTTASNSGETGWGDVMPWTQVTADLGAYAGSQIRLRWAFWSDGSVTASGTFVDDIVIVDP